MMRSRAEEIYRQYDGSGFHMHREGVMDEYRALGPTSEQEQMWRQELIAERIRDAEAGDRAALTSLQTLNAVEALPALATLAFQGDGFFRVLCTEAIWQLIELPSPSTLPRHELNAARRAAEEASREIARGQFVPPEEVSEVFLEIVGATNIIDYLAERAASNLKRYASSLSWLRS